MVRQHLALNDLDTGLLTCAEHGHTDFTGRACIDTRHTLPRVPGDVGIHLKSMMCRQGFPTPGTSPGLQGFPTPGASPGLQGFPTPGASPGLQGFPTPGASPGSNRKRHRPPQQPELSSAVPFIADKSL